MAGYTRNDTPNNIADGKVINASDLDGEFDSIQTAFGTGGHTHDGTAGNGPQIGTGGIADAAVTNAKIADDAVTGAKIDSTTDVVVNKLTASEVQLAGGTGTQGSVTWNADEETLDVVQNGTTLQLGQEVQYSVINQSGGTIPDGIPVMAVGTLGASGKILIDVMDGTNIQNAKFFLGFTTEAIDNGNSGKVTSFGKVRGLNTDPWTEGDVIWIDTASAGQITNVEPSSGMRLPVGFVVTVNTNNGVIFVRATTGHALHESHDVVIESTVADNEVLAYDSTTGSWINQTASEAGITGSGASAELTGDVTGSATVGSDGSISIATTVGNDSHTHAFFNLTDKDAGTGDYSTSGNLISGRASGGVALTINDSQGNANVTFNHANGSAEQAGNIGRIEVNTDSTTGAYMAFHVDNNNTVGTVTATERAAVTTSGFDVTGDITVSGTVDGRDVAADGTKLDGIEDGAQVNVATNLSHTASGTALTVESSTGTDTDLPAATTTTWGVMTDEDKSKLDGIATNANNYTHPTHNGDDIDIDTTELTGATVISDLDFNITTDTSGHVTAAAGTVATRELTASDISALPISGGTLTGNLGVGVAAPAWNANYDVVHVNTATSLAATSVATVLSTNAYNDGTYKRIQNDQAARYTQLDGNHAFEYAGLGAADSTITWSTVLSAQATGRVGVGIATPAQKLHVYGPTDPRIRIQDGVTTNFTEIGTTADTSGSLVLYSDRLALGGSKIAFNVAGSEVGAFDASSLKIPSGTTAERPTAVQGMIRYNTDLSSFEGHDGSAWGTIGGGATGGGANAAFWENDITISSDYSITSGKNAGTFGPVTIADGVTITVPDGSVWTIV